MDTNNPGGEVEINKQQMQQASSMLHTQQDEVPRFDRKTFFEKHPTLTDAELDQFRKDQTEIVQGFLHEYLNRVKNATITGREADLVVQAVPVQQSVPPVQEETDEKTLKKKQKQREKKINAGKKKGILAASEYSLDMCADYVKYMKQKEPSDYNKEEGTRAFKKHLSKFEINLAVADPAYVGQNLAEVQAYMDDLKEAIDFFTIKYPEVLSTMSLTFQQKVGNALQSYPIIEAAYDNSLMKNGLKRNGDQLVPITGNDLLQLRSDEMVRQSLIDRIEENKAGLDAIVEDEVKMHSEKLVKTFLEDGEETREAFKADEKTSFIQTEKINNEMHFKALDYFASLMEEHPAEYAANKEVLDAMLVYVKNIMEAVVVYTAESQFDFNMPENIEPEVEAALKDLADKSQFKKDDLQETITMTEMSLKHILEGGPIFDKAAEFLHQFGYSSPEYIANQERAVEATMLYKDEYKYKTAIWLSLTVNESEEVQNALKNDTRAFMLMRTDDTEEALEYNKQVLVAKKYVLESQKKDKTQEERDAAQSAAVQIYREKFQNLYDRVMEVELEDLMRMDDQGIMERQSELLRLGMENMHMSDCCKMVDPVTKKSVKDLVFPTPELGEIFSHKINIIQNYMTMGRMIGIIEAYKKDALTRDAVTESEEKKLGTFGKAGNVNDEILKYAKKTYLIKKKNIEDTRKLLNKAYRDHCEAVLLAEAVRSDEQKKQRDTAAMRIFGRIEEAIKPYEERVKNGSLTECRQVYNELVEAGKQEDADLLEIYYALKIKDYHITGSNETIGEPLFRSFAWASTTKGLSDFSDEEFLRIAKSLSAGHLKKSEEKLEEGEVVKLTEAEIEEEAAAMKQKNEEGLYSLLQKLAVHLDYVEKKYGYEVPNFEYTTTHFAEIQDDFVFGQVCNHIVEHANVLDMNKPEDVRIMHQIKFYNEVGIKAFSMFTSVATEQNIKFREDNVDRCRNLDSIADSMNYLKAHPMNN